MDSDKVDHAISSMIEKMILDEAINADIVSLTCRDFNSLTNAAKVLYRLGITFKAILFPPRAYWIFNFDAIDVAFALGDYKNDLSNKTIIVHDTDSLECGDLEFTIQCKNGFNTYRLSLFSNN